MILRVTFFFFIFILDIIVFNFLFFYIFFNAFTLGIMMGKLCKASPEKRKITSDARVYRKRKKRSLYMYEERSLTLAWSPITSRSRKSHDSQTDIWYHLLLLYYYHCYYIYMRIVLLERRRLKFIPANVSNKFFERWIGNNIR